MPVSSSITAPAAITSSSIRKKPLLRVTLAWHNKDLKRRTLKSIIEHSGYTVEEFIGRL